MQIADDTLPADTAYRLACEGQAMLWRGDFQNARQLLSALGRRLDKPARETSAKARHRRAGKEDAKPVFPHAFTCTARRWRSGHAFCPA